MKRLCKRILPKFQRNLLVKKGVFDIMRVPAKRLLSQTGLKAYEIAEEVGIKDPHYFSVCFKKYTGKSVSQYRQEQQE